MISREELVRLLNETDIAYGGRFAPSSDRMKEWFDIWYDHMKDIPVERVTQAFHSFCAENKFPPTIADIKKSCEEYAKVEQRVDADVKQWFRSMCDSYPADKDEKAAWEIFWGLVKRVPVNDRVLFATTLYGDCVDFVESEESKGSPNIITFEEYMGRVRDEWTQKKLSSAHC